MAAAVAEALRGWAAEAARRDAAWRAAVAACAPLLASLAGLAAQMRATRRLAWDGTPLGAFSELRERLWRKQRGAAEALMEELCGRRYLEIRLFLLLISCDRLADMEALPRAWEKILERYGEDTVRGCITVWVQNKELTQDGSWSFFLQSRQFLGHLGKENEECQAGSDTDLQRLLNLIPQPLRSFEGSSVPGETESEKPSLHRRVGD
ncbi:hypothetical protein ASZ78_011951 [Callipepla squamata]|uniref:Uncharacterized protein n=1 Tax=Callipepla squamata TaxID=9009 RepID=A0A226NG40_CALSU|nr:hypothetical protein ASZ78_011951 [Callipepla squamata]